MRGQLYYFGKVAGDPAAQAALSVVIENPFHCQRTVIRPASQRHPLPVDKQFKDDTVITEQIGPRPRVLDAESCKFEFDDVLAGFSRKTLQCLLVLRWMEILSADLAPADKFRVRTRRGTAANGSDFFSRVLT